MAETGPFSVPLECYTKKAIISGPIFDRSAGCCDHGFASLVSPRVVDMGLVILGESGTSPSFLLSVSMLMRHAGTQTVTVVNDGALEVPFIVTRTCHCLVGPANVLAVVGERGQPGPLGALPPIPTGLSVS